MLKSIQIFFVFLLLGVGTISWMVFAPTPETIGPYINGVFPSSTPGAGSSWELENPMPDLSIPSPLRIISFPGNSDLLVLSKLGKVWRVSPETQSQSVALDFTDRAFYKGEAGAVGIVLHPSFGDSNAPDKQVIFIFYRTKPEPGVWDEKGFNRLSKFTWDADAQIFDLDSEEILIQQYDRSTWHNGGGLFFGPDQFLYVSVGDEGDEQFQTVSNQTINRGLFSGILRIDVDNDPTRSHPIKRQPIANAAAPEGWGDTYTQGYSIPNDNPWVTTDSSHLEEFYAIGTRSPYSMYFDEETQRIWVADVGSNKREEINQVEKGDNLQWPYIEGTLPSEIHQKPIPLIGQEKPAYYEYDRTEGNCIIGGSIYRGDRFSELKEKFLFADFGQGKLKILNNINTTDEPTASILINNLKGQPVELPMAPGITGIFPQDDGHILITVTGEDFKVPGKILRLKRKTFIPDPPSKLSELGVFDDLSNLTPAAGIIPYTVNAPLWSDRALKKRWMAIPNDGSFDTKDEQIKFEATKEWTFPEGTVFIKHFELPLTTDPNAASTPLETRFFIVGESGTGYGLTYKWNEDGTDATLMGDAISQDFDIYEDGAIAYTQTWTYPSREQCMTCHTDNAKYVLGLNTHQLNGDLFYPKPGQTFNQLDYLNQLGIFDKDIGQASDHIKAFPLDDTSVDLEVRIRSYLDANCASCHRLGGVPKISMDLRFPLSLALTNMINLPTQSENSDLQRMIIKPGDHADSEFWVRDASISDGQMPPLGRAMVDHNYIDSLAVWIDQLASDAGAINHFLIYPNPSSGSVAIRVKNNWAPPFKVSLKSRSGQTLYNLIEESNSFFLDLTNYPSGLYFLEVQSGDHRQVNKLILH